METPPANRPDLSALYHDLHPRLLTAARSWAPPGHAEDAVQETWAAVIAGIDRFEGRSKPSTWVFGILWRQSARRWRDRHRRNVPLADDLPGEDASRNRQAVDESAWSDPELLAECRIDSDIAMQTIAHLPLRYREIVTMRDIRGCTAVEAEAALGLSSANQRVLLHRARTRIRDELVELGVSPH